MDLSICTIRSTGSSFVDLSPFSHMGDTRAGAMRARAVYPLARSTEPSPEEPGGSVVSTCSPTWVPVRGGTDSRLWSIHSAFRKFTDARRRLGTATRVGDELFERVDGGVERRRPDVQLGHRRVKFRPPRPSREMGSKPYR